MCHIPRFPASCAVPKWRFPSLWCTCLFAKSDPRTRSAPVGLWVGTLGLSKYCSCSFFFWGGAMENPSVLDGHAHMNFKYVFFPAHIDRYTVQLNLGSSVPIDRSRFWVRYFQMTNIRWNSARLKCQPLTTQKTSPAMCVVRTVAALDWQNGYVVSLWLC
jgi:hypothetical protein